MNGSLADLCDAEEPVDEGIGGDVESGVFW